MIPPSRVISEPEEAEAVQRGDGALRFDPLHRLESGPDIPDQKRILIDKALQRGGPLGEAEIELVDDASEMHLFRFETFFNGYEALTLGIYLRPRGVTV